MEGKEEKKIFTNQNFYIDYYIIYINIQKNFYKFHFIIIKKVFMTVAIDYLLLIGFCFALSSGLFLGLKSIKLI
ncbi:cytochrome b6-f complex subunit 6 (plastid) [Nitzschia inconspicua]|uniref:Cytochrome b6-f complex subunit 6 n=1 Tax=Nitzschia inconspicua TaxID=303405 RepID=A0A8H2SIF2_9STRA|nr:cytochrome b6-f complex subunit 6 [Nitzschia inconspicua]